MSVGQMTTIDMGIVIPLALSNMVVQQLLVCYIFIDIQYHVTPFLFLFFFFPMRFLRYFWQQMKNSNV